MALDPAISDQLTATQMVNAQQGMARINEAGTNLVQGLGVIHNLSIQANSAGSQFGTDRTAIHVPASDGIGTALPK